MRGRVGQPTKPRPNLGRACVDADNMAKMRRCAGLDFSRARSFLDRIRRPSVRLRQAVGDALKF
jgi:hypothetical protein